MSSRAMEEHTLEDDAEGAFADLLANTVVDADDVC